MESSNVKAMREAFGKSRMMKIVNIIAEWF